MSGYPGQRLFSRLGAADFNMIVGLRAIRIDSSKILIKAYWKSKQNALGRGGESL